MRRLAAFVTVGLVLSQCGRTYAGGPPWQPGCCAPPPCATSTPLPGSATAPNTLPGTAADQTAQPPSTDAFAQAPPSGGEAAQSALPNMIGDLGISGSVLNFVTSTRTVTNSFGVSRTVTTRRPVYVPIASRGSFKISEDESPRPQDRFYIGYNYFADVSTPGVSQFQVHTETFGFEKTFLDGNASFGMRVPVVEQSGTYGTDDVGDLSFILKYAIYNDRETGNLFSGGLVVTAPTGQSITLADGTSLHSTLLQPYLGFIWSAERFYTLGFAEVVIPTEAQDVTFGAVDIGAGYRVSDLFIPTLEVHVNTALNHHGLENAPIGFADSVVLTSGFHSQIGRALFTLGLAVPVTGPRIYDVEAIAQFNFRF